MQIFKLKKGGETENVKETVVVLNKNRDIDKELLMSAINIAAKDNPSTAYEVIAYLDNQFEAIESYEDEVETFYY